MENSEQHTIHHSWYHERWFRVLLVIVGFNMVILGFTIILNPDLLSFVQKVHSAIRIIAGLAYILVASFVIYYALSYEKLLKEIAKMNQEVDKED